ncbi:cytochrome c oxidase assembly protein [Marinobacter bryozoorum]|jgi:putative membrane protein|uniref:cytochrome c oxidase assembly protein n=1 Tax=Marinobacter bryozoorum TaxID=256324 RepID=UPI002005A3F5|nr:cytochrome c oxidase assembly protein [Marinobacter bryozoorum]MCK7543792.1 cytochrome c oxidase assembly protein [Marinobacter bryozoorum]
MNWNLLLPYDFSPLTILAYLLVASGYIVALKALPGDEKPGPVRIFAFFLGLLLCYAVMQTWFDYYSQYMFFIHRGQHLILHHLGPMLIALSNPLPILRYWHRQLAPAMGIWALPVRWGYNIVQQPFIAAFLFAGLVYFWLWPPVHFNAMLSRDLYWVMNWSMLLDGLLFWWLIFDSRSPHDTPSLGYGKRILLLVLVAVPQMVLGAWIVFNRGMVYDVYEVCGRAWPMSPADDQLIGGILTWIPPAMMSVVGILILIGRAMKDDRPRPRHRLAEELTP